MESGLRLIAVGCSQTYGHCLPDCYIEDPNTSDGLGIAPNPSKMAFPQLVGSFIGAEVHNLSFPGGSTRNMWHELMNFNYHPDDYVICVWTFANRSMLIKRDKKTHLGIWPSVSPLNQAYQRFIALGNSDEDLELSAYQNIDHAHRVVQPQVKKILHYKINRFEYETVPSWAQFEFTNALDYMIPNDKLDYAIDEKHYGVESHKCIARQMIQDLTIAAN